MNCDPKQDRHFNSMRHTRLAAIVLLAACGDGGTNPTAPPSSSAPPAPVATTVTLPTFDSVDTTPRAVIKDTSLVSRWVLGKKLSVIRNFCQMIFGDVV